MKLILLLTISSLAISSSSALFLKAKLASGLIGGVKSPAVVTQIRQVQPVQTIQAIQPIQPIQVVRTIQQQPIQTIGEVQVPVVSSRDVQVMPVPVEPSIPRTQVVSVEPSGQAVHLVFKSQSSPLSVQQQHIPSERTYYEATRSEEPPHVLRHEVFKPVVQELRETIQPYRQITQEIKPVLEKVNVLVPRAQPVISGSQPSISSQVQPIQPPPVEQPRYLPLPQVVSSAFAQVIPARPAQIWSSQQQGVAGVPVQVQFPQYPIQQQQFPVPVVPGQVFQFREQRPILNVPVEQQQVQQAPIFDEPQQQAEEGFD